MTRYYQANDVDRILDTLREGFQAAVNREIATSHKTDTAAIRTYNLLDTTLLQVEALIRSTSVIIEPKVSDDTPLLLDG